MSTARDPFLLRLASCAALAAQSASARSCWESAVPKSRRSAIAALKAAYDGTRRLKGLCSPRQRGGGQASGERSSGATHSGCSSAGTRRRGSPPAKQATEKSYKMLDFRLGLEMFSV